jgi:cell division protein FtsL
MIIALLVFIAVCVVYLVAAVIAISQRVQDIEVSCGIKKTSNQKLDN